MNEIKLNFFDFVFRFITMILLHNYTVGKLKKAIIAPDFKWFDIRVARSNCEILINIANNIFLKIFLIYSTCVIITFLRIL